MVDEAAAGLRSKACSWHEFNPVGIVVPKKGRAARAVRSWRTFREHKHGKDRFLRAAEAELDACLGTNVQRLLQHIAGSDGWG
jgi:hypothetical protein